MSRGVREAYDEGPEESAAGGEWVSEILDAVAFPVRLRMLRILSSTELSYTDLMNAVGMKRGGDIGRFTYHLKRLLRAGLIEVNRESRLYRLSRVGRAVLESIDDMAASVARQEAAVRTSEPSLAPFDKLRISNSLIREAGMPPRLAYRVAVSVERKLRDLRIDRLSSSMIRELVNAELIYMGLEKYRDRHARVGIPIHEVSQMIKRASQSEGALGLLDAAASGVFRDYLLTRWLPQPLSDLCFSGSIEIWELERWITHLLCLEARADAGGMEEALLYGLSGLALQEVTLTVCGEWEKPDGLTALARAKRAITLNFPCAAYEALGGRGMLRDPVKKLLSALESVIELGSLRAAYPLNDYATLALAPERGSRVLYSTAGVFESRRGGRVWVGGIVGINMVKAFIEAGRDIDAASERLRDMVGATHALFYRKRRILERLSPGEGGLVVYFLFAPVGLYEVARCESREGGTMDEAETYQRLLGEVRSEARTASQGGVGISLASAWPPELSRRVAKRNIELFGAKALSQVIGGEGAVDSYLERVVPPSAEALVEKLHRLDQLFESGLMIDIPREEAGSSGELLGVLKRCSNTVVRIAGTGPGI